MDIAITIIVCIVLLCIIPSIGTRRPRGYRPTRHIEHPVPPRGFGSDVAGIGQPPLNEEQYNELLEWIVSRQDSVTERTLLSDRYCSVHKKTLLSKSTNPLLNRPPNPDLDIIIKRH
jgi:hypothetical protein